MRGTVRQHPERETIEIALPEALPPGEARLDLRFSGRLRKDLCGLYGVEVGDSRYAFTQLAAASARKFFPCFDEPAMKARFAISVTTAKSNSALSNSPIERIEQHEDGHQTIVFERTPLLSSYLIALAVGELECAAPLQSGKTGNTGKTGKTEIRVWHTPDKPGLDGFALEVAGEVLVRLESYFDLPYPYAKLDLVAVPDFEFGAMENAGAVFFRETLLLVDPETVTLAEKKRSAEVICHEIAHMWYGDLVTMAWWDDLWLNEAFATWMAFAIVDQWKPEWNMWNDFQHHRSSALDLDALRNTHPIYATVRTPSDMNENFDVITYEKGASVVRMIEHYLSHETFREGVRLYIRRHRESTAVAADLWNALSEASGEDIERLVRPWIEKEGYPVVTVRRRERDGLGVIELSQRRFTERALREPRRRATTPGKAKAGTRWPIPWVGRVGTGVSGETRTIRHLLLKQRDFIPADGADLTFVYGNADEGGFFRPHHGDSELRDLLNELSALSPAERIGFVDHQWSLVRAGLAPLASFMDLAASVGADPDPDVLTAVKRPLTTLVNRLAPDADSSGHSGERLRAWIEVYYGGQLDELGWEPERGETEATGVRRSLVIDITGGLGRASSVQREAEARCRALLADRRSLDPNLADVVVSLAARWGSASLYEDFLAKSRSAQSPQEQRRFLLTLADFSAPALIDRTLRLSLSRDDVATQDVVFLLIRLFANPAAAERTWAFIQKRWPKLRRRVPPLLASRLIAATPALGTRAHRKEVAAFFRANPLPSSGRVLRQALERFDAYLEFANRSGPELIGYLEG